MFLTGSEWLTTTRYGPVTASVMGARSRLTSYGAFFLSVGSVAITDVCSRIV